MYKPKDLWFQAVNEGNVRTDGGSLTLGAGELAVVDLSTTISKTAGVKVLSDFAPLSSSAKLAIRIGEGPQAVSRSEGNKHLSTIPFVLKDITNIYVDAPQRAGIKVDDFIIGYNGKDGSEIVLDEGDNDVIELTLMGNLMGMIGLPDSKHTVSVNLTAPRGTRSDVATPAAGEWTMEEVVTNAYKELKNYKLPGNVDINDYVDILLVNSTNPETIPGTATTFYELGLADDGTFTDLGKVQAQYPELDVKKLNWIGGITTYSVISSTAPAAYQAKPNFALKGCEDCPAGFTELSEGFVYQVVLENDGADATAAVQALPGATAGTASLNETDGDTTFYSVVTNDELTEAEIDAFIGANATAKIELISQDVVDLCQSATPASVAWVEGESCNTNVETYTITLADTKCGDSRLPELQAAFPELTITETSVGECQRTYSADVVTDLVCEECSPIFRDVFTSEAPDDFDFVSWEAEPATYDGTAKMGIRVRGKRSTLAGNEFLRDEMPFIDTSVSISLVGGFPTWTNESYNSGDEERFEVKILSRKADAQNIGGNLRKYEEEGQVNFRGRSRYHGNNYGKLVNGQETRFDALQNYIVYSITIAPLKFESNFQQPQNGAFTYHYPVEIGKQGQVETLFNKLATASGLPQVKAVSE